jgi:hypothetical protein
MISTQCVLTDNQSIKGKPLYEIDLGKWEYLEPPLVHTGGAVKQGAHVAQI